MGWGGPVCDCSPPSQTGTVFLIQRGHCLAPACGAKEARCQVQALGKGRNGKWLGEVSGPQPCVMGLGTGLQWQGNWC